MKRFNPYIAAFQAAATVLTSPEAQQYYSIRAQQDIQTIVVVAIQIGSFALGMGQKARDLYKSAKAKVQAQAQVVETEPMPEVEAQPVEVEIVTDEPKEIRLLSPAPVVPSPVPPIETWLTRQILYPAIVNSIALPPINPPTQPVLTLPPAENSKPVAKPPRTRKPRGAAKGAKPKAMTGPETVNGRAKGTSVNGVWID